MISVVLIGTGNVATHLFETFLAYDTINVVQVVGRSKESLSKFASKTATASLSGILKKADVYCLAVTDEAIPKLVASLKCVEGLIVHTSGTVPLSALTELAHTGVFYPLQTFTKNTPLNFRAIPICLEVKDPKDFKPLKFIAETISDRVYEITSEKRKKLHLAAVFANNFTNHLYGIASDICEESNVSFDILKPLIQETAFKINLLSPTDAQTGPARRNDIQTMQTHLDQLASKEQQQLYKLLSESIQKKYLNQE